MNEQKKYEVIKRLVDENSNKDRAALILGITKRQVYHLIKVYHEKGKEGFVHGNRGRKLCLKRNPQMKKSILH